MRYRVRLLPVLIFMATLTLTLKLGGIWQTLDVVGPSPAAAAADKAGGTGKDAKTGTPDKTGGAARDGGNKAVRATAGPPPFDPTKATDAELEVLEKLAARRSTLDRRARDLDLRDTLLKATESRIEGKIDELRKIKKTIEALLRKHDAQHEAKMKSLVKIYESMKPKDAARIFEKLDLEVLLNVVERMREARTAPILAKMTASRAKTVTTALATRRSLPSIDQKAATTNR